jgi:hypothetical protein
VINLFHSYNSKKCFQLLLILIFCILNSLTVGAKQHPAVLNVLEQCSKCGINQVLSPNEFNLTKRQNLISELNYADLSAISASFIEDTNLFPVDNCVLRGNKKFYKGQNLHFAKKLKTQTLIRTDAVSYAEKSKYRIDQLDIPLNGLKAPNASKLKYLVKALDQIAEATPEKRVYVSCFFGKHRSGLVVGMYQFLREYKKDPISICTNIGSSQDKVYVLMNAIAAKGTLTYDMPSDFRQFYKDFAKSVCTEESDDFLLGKKTSKNQ